MRLNLPILCPVPQRIYISSRTTSHNHKPSHLMQPPHNNLPALHPTGMAVGFRHDLVLRFGEVHCRELFQIPLPLASFNRHHAP